MPATSPAARTAAAYAALMAGHELGDYVVQRDTDAADKGKPGRTGRAACARHCLTYTATQAAALYAAHRLLGLRLNPGRAAAGLALSGLTHYAIDRCATHWPEDGPDAPALVRAAHALGKGRWLQRDPGAAALLDQALHKGCIAVAAAIAGASR
ncbi:DUF3307 domain-containing protein [Streptomyces sp. 049-1]|uniref:DUF3307 domain-containing protein n=1 Tax=Streptomyces sp. 049-1 TaxID=2789264 RepID=UPI00397F8642